MLTSVRMLSRTQICFFNIKKLKLLSTICDLSKRNGAPPGPRPWRPSASGPKWIKSAQTELQRSGQTLWAL